MTAGRGAEEPREAYLQEISVPFDYPVYFTRRVFDPSNPILKELLARREPERRHRALVYVDSGVANATPDLCRKIESYFAAFPHRLELAAPPHVVPGGEEVKNGWAVVKGIMEDIGNAHLCRQSFVVVVGGGSVLDMVGFAASIVHRGIRTVRVPTTVLAQNDAGVGVKNGMNEHGVKNYVGTFWPPFGVVNDFDFLLTLEHKHWIGGVAEAFKVAIIKDSDFFDFLYSKAEDLNARKMEPMEEVVRRCAVLHLEHIRTSGDPFEMGSARPLDFGHWSSHRLEVLSRYTMTHGQAVAVGIALDSVYAARKGLLGEEELERILKGLTDCGLAVWTPLLEQREKGGRLAILKGLDDFREHLGGQLTVTLPLSIGKRCEVNEMDEKVIEEAVAYLKERFGG